MLQIRSVSIHRSDMRAAVAASAAAAKCCLAHCLANGNWSATGTGCNRRRLDWKADGTAAVMMAPELTNAVVRDNGGSGNRYAVVYVGQCGSGRGLHCPKKLVRVLLPVAYWRGLGTGAVTSCHYSTALHTPQRSGYHYHRCRSRRHW